MSFFFGFVEVRFAGREVFVISGDVFVIKVSGVTVEFEVFSNRDYRKFLFGGDGRI